MTYLTNMGSAINHFCHVYSFKTYCGVAIQSDMCKLYIILTSEHNNWDDHVIKKLLNNFQELAELSLSKRHKSTCHSCDILTGASNEIFYQYLFYFYFPLAVIQNEAQRNNFSFSSTLAGCHHLRNNFLSTFYIHQLAMTILYYQNFFSIFLCFPSVFRKI